MIEKILNNPEIWRIEIILPNSPLKNLNSYVIKTEEQNLVIDTGYNREECKEQLFDGLDELQIDMAKTSLFLTHFHSDHMGLVQEFVDRDCKVYMGRVDYEYFSRLKSGETSFAMSEVLLEEGFPQEILDLQSKVNDGSRFAPETIFPAKLLEDDDIIQLGDIELHCIHTPGHTPGHMMLYLPKFQVLFTGDHVLFDITPNISIWKMVENSLGDYMNSLKRTKEIPVKYAFPAHRSKHIELNERIDQILSHHNERLKEIINAVELYPESTAYEIASKITWSMKGRKWDDAPADQKWFAMGETLAHLYYLVLEERVERKSIENRVVYTTMLNLL